jgi:hypothetical protein
MKVGNNISGEMVDGGGYQHFGETSTSRIGGDRMFLWNVGAHLPDYHDIITHKITI